MVAKHGAGSMPSNFLEMTVDTLFAFEHSSNPREKELKSEEKRYFWNPVLYYKLYRLDRLDWNSWLSKYSFVKALRTVHPEKEGNLVYLPARCAFVWWG